MSVQACAEIVRKGDPDRFLATMAAPPAARAVLFPLYAFNVEVARAPWVTEEPMIAEMRLQWWRDALAEIGQGGTVRKHEVVTPLASILDPSDVVVLDTAVNARRWDIYKEAFENSDHFSEYLDATAGGLMLVAAHLLGVKTADQQVRNYGASVGLANWLTAIPDLESRGRIPLVDGRPEVVAMLAKSALTKLRTSKRSLPKTAYAATRTGWLADRTLRSAAATPAVVLNGRLHNSEFLKKSMLIWTVLTRSP